MQDLISVEEALALVLAHTPGPRTARVPLDAAVGRTLAADVYADRDYPPFDRSRVDGYAIDAKAGVGAYEVVGEIPAGSVPDFHVGSGQAARIFTGAPLPSGTDAVVMQERCTRDGDTVRVELAPDAGQNVTPRGCESAEGGVVARAGDRIGPAVLGALATVGATSVDVHPAPAVHVIATGDELVPIDQVPGPGRIRNSNAHALVAAAREAGAGQVTHEYVGDDAELLHAAIERGLSADVLLLTGGVSVGDYDLVPAALEECGVATHFHGVRLQPGKPLLFGSRGDALVFGLPGNPVSALVNHHLFVRQSLALLAGAPAPGHPTETATLVGALGGGKWRRQYVPVRLDFDGDRLLADVSAYRGSGDVFGFARSDALAIVLPDDAPRAAGETVPVLVL